MDFLSNNFIADFFLIALKWFYSIIHDYSIAIIVLTILLRAAMLPLDIKQRRNTTKMSQIQPELELLKKKFGSNPQQLQVKQKELYAEMGVKPLGGCLPMVVQMLIFFAFFGAMRVIASEQAVSLYLNALHLGPEHAQLPQWLWVHNFWQPDSGFRPVLPTATDFSSFVISNAKTITPQTLSILQLKGLISFGSSGFMVNNAAYDALSGAMTQANHLTGVMNGWFILPLVAGASLFLQQKIQAAGGGAMAQQQQQMKFMLYFFPLFSIWICESSNTAFAIYWLASNVYAIGQQLIINYISNKKKKVALEVKEVKK